MINFSNIHIRPFSKITIIRWILILQRYGSPRKRRAAKRLHRSRLQRTCMTWPVGVQVWHPQKKVGDSETMWKLWRIEDDMRKVYVSILECEHMKPVKKWSFWLVVAQKELSVKTSVCMSNTRKGLTRDEIKKYIFKKCTRGYGKMAHQTRWVQDGTGRFGFKKMQRPK